MEHEDEEAARNSLAAAGEAEDPVIKSPLIIPLDINEQLTPAM